MNTLDKIAKNNEQKELDKSLSQEQKEEYNKAVQMVFDTPEGILFGKHLIKMLEVFLVKSCTNPTKMVEENAAKAVYLNMIRPHLTKKQKIELEL